MINPYADYWIGPATLDDLGRINRIEQAAFNTPWSRDLIRAAIVNDAYRVRALRTEADGLLGFYIAHPLRERSNLDNLAVDESARSQGWGSLLIDDWVAHARRERLAVLTLQVNTANGRAQKLYERFRFQVARLLVSYYPNGEDAYQMERVLRHDAPSAGRHETHSVRWRNWLRPARRG